ncbi:DNA topoisomerase 2-binding protein 1 [Trametes pubescens]|uniref:DNA topoisomerase 2-binding protein 1 n=1 Tax=Trametes pubescens TaxID=154538 RepID=A0A1M2V2F5_TRAPU|nr:DNA topoisomerase 2-binding protein 1 [Trametes pubescens]
MNFRRVNRSKKVPGVKLRPADPSARKDLRTPDSTWTHSSGLDSDEEATHADLCPRPFKGFVLCATGISDKTSLFKLALELGAQSVSDLTDRVTHLIAEEPGSAKYRCALETGIPIMRASWIIESHKIWLKGDDVDVAESIEEFRLPPFTGVVLCVSGIEDVNLRMEINRKVTKGGGVYVKQIERPVRVTHLLCANTSEADSEKVRYADKFNRLGEARIHIVWEDWFWDSLRFGGRFEEEAYKVSNPRPPPRVLPEGPPPGTTTTADETGVSSEIQNAEASAAGPSHTRHNDDDEEIASVKRVPAVTLHLWESILKPRGFELQQGRLIRSPSKSQSRPDISYRREPSPSARALRRGSLKEGDGDPLTPASAIQSFRRARSFAPAAKDVSTPLSRQPFRRAPTVAGEAMARSGRTSSSSFLGRSVGGVLAAGGISGDVPIASESAVAGPSRAGSAIPENADGVDVGGDVSEGARELFKGMRIRALGEARSANVRRAVEGCGGAWVSAHDDDDDTVDFIVVRLVSGSALFRREGDEDTRAKYRTECWLERCIFEERICAPEEHVAFAPLAVEAPISGTEDMVVSYSGLDQSEACWIRRLLRALGIPHAPNFSRRTTHLLCPSGEGAKAEKAREWGTPIIDMLWLAEMARTGQIPLTAPIPGPASVAGEGVVQRGEDLDLQVVDYTGAPEVMMATQQPRTASDRKGKGKEKEKASREASMVDITNEDRAPKSQSLSYYDPPPPGSHAPPAEEGESFGLPAMLLGANSPPSTPRRPSKTPPPPPAPEEEEAAAPPRTQASADPPATPGPPIIPSRVFDDRVPSSESPSPMRIPGARTPSTPARVGKQATRVLQRSISTLLGKRSADAVEEVEEREDEAKKAKGPNVPLGKRARPLNRSRSNLSFTDSLTPGRLTPGFSPGPGARSRGTTTPAPQPTPQPAPAPAPEPELIPPLDVPGAKPRSTASGDEGDNSFVAAKLPERTHVLYADPKQHGVRERLMHLFEVSGGPAREDEDVAVGGAGMHMDVEEMTLQQLPDIAAAAAAAAGRKSAGKGKRGRGRKGARS